VGAFPGDRHPFRFQVAHPTTSGSGIPIRKIQEAPPGDLKSRFEAEPTKLQARIRTGTGTSTTVSARDSATIRTGVRLHRTRRTDGHRVRSPTRRLSRTVQYLSRCYFHGFRGEIAISLAADHQPLLDQSVSTGVQSDAPAKVSRVNSFAMVT
jgi:hypothetical protein